MCVCARAKWVYPTDLIEPNKLSTFTQNMQGNKLQNNSLTCQPNNSPPDKLIRPLKHKPTNCVTIKLKFHSRTGQESPEEQQDYSSTLSLSWTLERMGGQCHVQVGLPKGKRPVTIVRDAGWTPGLVWTGAEYLAPTTIRCPDSPVRSEWLYRLSYCGPQLHYNKATKLGTRT